MKLQLSGQIKSNSKDYSSGFSEIDYRIAGAVTSYNETEEASNVILAQTKIQKARVEVTYALVNPVTGKTLVSKSGYGEYKKETGGILGLGSSSSGDLSLREGALRDALNKATTEILKEIKKLPYSAKIVEVQDDMLYIKIGAKSNIPVGSKLKVYKIGRAIKDSSTGEHLGFVRSSIGEVTISQHINENISIAPMKALSDIKPGDQVELIK